MNFLENIVKAVAPKTHERIGEYLKGRRESKENISDIREILALNGVKGFEQSWMNDEDWKGKSKVYPVNVEIGKVFPEGCTRFYLAPVNMHFTSDGDDYVSLYLIDARNKKIKVVANSGNRGVHYEGKVQFTPLAISEREEDGKVIVAYEWNNHARVRDFFNYNFRYFYDVNKRDFGKEVRIAEIDIKDMEARE